MIYRYRHVKPPMTAERYDPDELALFEKIVDRFRYVVTIPRKEPSSFSLDYLRVYAWCSDRFGNVAYTVAEVENGDEKMVDVELLEGRWLSLNPWNPLPFRPNIELYFRDARDAMLFKLNHKPRRS